MDSTRSSNSLDIERQGAIVKFKRPRGQRTKPCELSQSQKQDAKDLESEAGKEDRRKQSCGVKPIVKEVGTRQHIADCAKLITR